MLGFGLAADVEAVLVQELNESLNICVDPIHLLEFGEVSRGISNLRMTHGRVFSRRWDEIQ